VRVRMDGFAVVAIECMHYSIQTSLSVLLYYTDLSVKVNP